MNDDYDFAGKSVADILLSYTANKGLQNLKYSKTTEKILTAAVKDLEKFSDRLTILSTYLVLFKLESGPGVRNRGRRVPNGDTKVGRRCVQTNTQSPAK